MTLTGEIVDISCYKSKGVAGGTGAAHVDCAKMCVLEKGAQVGILSDGDGLFKIWGPMAASKYAKVLPYHRPAGRDHRHRSHALEQLRRPLVRTAIDQTQRKVGLDEREITRLRLGGRFRTDGAGDAGEHHGAGRTPRRQRHLTYAKDVAPIMQRSCQTCHRPGTNAPMSLLTYEDVRPWARAIKNKVTQRLMPPWHIERNVGIQKFKDDPSLSDTEIATITSWVDGGAPKGSVERHARRADIPRRRGVAHRHARSDRRDSQAARRSRRRRRPVDRLHRGFRHDRGSLPAGG